MFRAPRRAWAGDRPGYTRPFAAARTVGCFLVLAVLFPGVRRGFGEDTPIQSVSRVALDAAGEGGLLIQPPDLRVRAGDGADWMRPELTDAAWERIAAFDPLAVSGGGGAAQQVVWFRFRLDIAPDLVNVPLAFKAKPFQDHLEIYVNGKITLGAQDFDATVGKTPRNFLFPDSQCTVAIRWTPNTSLPNTTPGEHAGRVFALSVHDYERVLSRFDRGEQLEVAYARHRLVLITAFFVFFLFHLGLYVSRQWRRENFYYCLTALLGAAALLALHVSEIYHYDRAVWRIAYSYGFLLLMPLTIVSGLALLQIMLTGRTRWTLAPYFLLALAAYAASFRYGNTAVHWFPVLVVPELVRLLWPAANRAGLVSGRRLLATFAMLSAILTATASIQRWDSESGFLRYSSWYLFVAFMQAVSFSFAREYARAMNRVRESAASLSAQVADRTRERDEATLEIKVLHGILPICMHCHRIRTDEQSWQRLEKYIQQHSEATFSHGLCPDCLRKHYAQYLPPNVPPEQPLD